MTDAANQRPVPDAETELTQIAESEKRGRRTISAAAAKRRRVETHTKISLAGTLTAGFTPHKPALSWFSWASPAAREAAETVNRIARRAGSPAALRALLAHIEDEATAP